MRNPYNFKFPRITNAPGPYLRTVTCSGVRGVILGDNKKAKEAWKRGVNYFFNVVN